VQERRREVRSRIFKGAKLIFGRTSVIDCSVRDITRGGAGFYVPNTVTLPDKLDLSFDAGHTTRTGRIVWRLWNRAAIKFDL